MDNVIQKIKIEDIIPSNFYNNSKDLQELAISIKNYGILEPLLLRPKNDKYEIILGNKRYQAAKMVGLSEIPALVKEVDDEVFNQYTLINRLQQKQSQNPVKENQEEYNIPPQPTNNLENQQNNKEINNYKREYNNSYANSNIQSRYNNINKGINSDIVNLSELNKKEERDEQFMNNGQINNNIMNNNLGGTPITNNNSVQEPSFGGRFFPSLEDEPTNMNMGGMGMNSPIAPPNGQDMSKINNTPNNNFIDLTDIVGEKEQQIPQSSPSIENTSALPREGEFIQNNSPEQPLPNISQFSQPQQVINTPLSLNPQVDNIGVSNNMQTIQGNNPINMNQNFSIDNMEELTQDFQPASIVQNQPQYDMSQNIAPISFNQPQPINNIEGISQNDSFKQNIPTPINEISPINNDMSTVSLNPEIPQMTTNSLEEPQQFPQKEVLPVVNTIKSVAASLEQFGYKINIADEDGINSYKITIEVEK